MGPHGRQSDDRAVSRPFGDNPEFFFSQQEKQQLEAEAKRRVPRGRRSAVRAGSRFLATLRAIRLFRPFVGERVAQIRWWVS